MKRSFGGGRPSMSSAPLRAPRGKSRSLGGSSSSSFGAGPSSQSSRTSTGRTSTGFGAGASSQSGRTSSSSQSGRMSFLPKTSRPSSGIGVRGRTDVPTKDPRPISDKQHMNASIRKLLEFLMTNTYPNPISHKLLVSPTSKDFFRIFTFVYGCLRPGYKMVAKMEEEVPRVLKLIGYPFSISKQYLYSVGSPHTWPHLLAALMWMIELINVTMSITMDHGGIDSFIFGANCAEEFDRKSDDQIRFEYAEKTYEAFMRGEDEYDKYDEELRVILKQAYQGEDIESIDEENRRLEEDLDQVAQEEASLQKMQESISNMKHDEVALTQYISDLERVKKMSLKDMQECEDSGKLLESDLAVEQDRLANLQLVYENQDLTPGDVSRLKTEQARLKGQVEQVEREIEEIEAENWKVNIDQTNVNDKVDSQVATYNRQAITLKLVPETAELANGKDFRLKSGFTSDIEGNFENIIKPVLQMMKNQHNNNAWRKDKEMFQLKCQLEKNEEQLNEENERFAKGETELSNIESEITSLKQVFITDKRSGEGECENLLKDIQQLEAEQAALETSHAEAVTQLVNKKQQYDEANTKSEKIQAEIDEYRPKYQEALRVHKEKVENRAQKSIDNLKAAIALRDQHMEEFEKDSADRAERITKLLNDNGLGHLLKKD